MLRSARRALTLTWVSSLFALVLITACGGDGTAPPKAVTIVFLGDVNQSGTVGQIITPGPQIEIRDAQGNPLSGVAFTVAVQGGGTLVGTPAKTTAGATALGTWTLGTTSGAQSITVSTSGVAALTISASATAAAASTTSSGGVPTVSSGAVGAVSASRPQIKVVDQFGNPVVGLGVTVQITGGGSVQNQNPSTGADGIASVGSWTLGTTSGTQRVTLAVGGFVASVTYTATVEAGPATGAVAVSAIAANGTPGAISPISPTVKVVDAFGNGVAGIAVAVAVGASSGTITNANPVTDATGQASAGIWTLSSGTSAQTVTMTPTGFPPVVFTVTPSISPFSINVRFIGGVSTVVQTAIIAAAQRIQNMITADLPDQTVANLNADGCANGAGTLSETIDDLVIYVTQVPLAQGLLARAGFCTPLRSAAPGLPFVGTMEVNTNELPLINSSTAFATAIITHEMLHVLGIGTLWRPFSSWPLNFLQGPLLTNPLFSGTQGFAAYQAAGGIASGVPVEPGTGNDGSSLGHWRESALDAELMTPFAEQVGVFMPLSAITIRSLADLGYAVTIANADPFAVPAGGDAPNAALRAPKISLDGDVLAPRPLRDLRGRPVLAFPIVPKR